MTATEPDYYPENNPAVKGAEQLTSGFSNASLITEWQSATPGTSRLAQVRLR
jgi:hypothetical protein